MGEHGMLFINDGVNWVSLGEVIDMNLVTAEEKEPSDDCLGLDLIKPITLTASCNINKKHWKMLCHSRKKIVRDIRRECKRRARLRKKRKEVGKC